MKNTAEFHIHLVSDATGETLINIARAAAAQYDSAHAIEHIHPMIRSRSDLDRVAAEIASAPGIVLYTLIEPEHARILETQCQDLSIPFLSVLDPILSLFESYLGTQSQNRVGAQHTMDTEYFRRIDALNYTMLHDDGQMPQDLNLADIVITGISRTSKTPTSIYLANRGYKTANMPLVPDLPVPDELLELKSTFIIGLIASPDRIVQIRQHRLLSMNADGVNSAYINKQAIAEEIAFTRRLCAKKGWPIIDVTRRSIEETAAAILTIYQDYLTGQEKE